MSSSTFQASLDEPMTERRAAIKFLSQEQGEWFLSHILMELRVSIGDMANAQFWNDFFACSHLVEPEEASP